MDMSDLKLEDLELFVTVVESTSNNLAAEYLDTSPSTLSRRLKKLEKCLGTRLLERTTRRVDVTDAGKLFYRHCQQVLDQFEILSQQVSDRQDTLNGRISVYAPAELFRYWIKELVVEFRREYPKLRVEFVSGGAKPHLLKDNIDIMMHIDEPEDSSFIARKVNVARTSFYASTDYINQRGEPTRPEDMKLHDCIVENDQNRVARPWVFIDEKTTTPIKVREQYSSDSSELCRALAEQGQGIAMLPDFIARDSVADGRLVKLFGKYRGTAHNVYAMYASRKYVPRKIKVFVDFLAAHIPEEI
jgi:DNA-binding transcriptional LysR family regulator